MPNNTDMLFCLLKNENKFKPHDPLLSFNSGSSEKSTTFNKMPWNMSSLSRLNCVQKVYVITHSVHSMYVYVCMCVCMYVCMSKMATSSDVPRRSSDKFPKFHPWIFLLVAYLAYTSVVASAVNVCTSCEKMGITQELETSFKEAMRSGRLKAKEHMLPDSVGVSPDSWVWQWVWVHKARVRVHQARVRVHQVWVRVHWTRVRVH